MRRGTGRGATPVSAFDAALGAAGVANFNLVVLSSVIPPGAEVRVEEDPAPFPGAWGDRLYVVMARADAEPGERVAAGVGWVQAPDGRGLFVEVTGADPAEVRSRIEDSLADMVASRPGVRFGSTRAVIAETKAEEEPACAVVVAPYLAQGWRG